jgi:molecular chaperone GrpE
MQKKKDPKITHLEKENTELRLGWQRAQADFDNYKKRIEKEKLDWLATGKTDALETILPILDNIALATTHLSEERKSDQWIAGIIHISNQIESALADNGISRITPEVGQPFNPHEHEAISSQNSTEIDKDCIIKTQVAGYKIGDKIIRPARVEVSNGTGSDKKA